MTQPGYPSPSSSGERWNVNMPAVIGVVFVFLVAVIVWVVMSSGDDGDITQSDGTAPSVPTLAPTTVAPAIVTQPTVPGTTTPAPMPDPSAVPSTSVAPPTTVPVTVPATTPPTEPPTTTSPPAPPATTAPGADPSTVPGDVGVAGRPMQRPGCDDSYITVIASFIGPEATSESIGTLLKTYPRGNYLRTDQTCPSLNPSVDGQPIYVVYFGPFAFDVDACTARADGAEGSYAKQLSNDVGPEHVVPCP